MHAGTTPIILATSKTRHTVLPEDGPIGLKHCKELRVEYAQSNATILTSIINLLKPTGHVMHHQFNIQQLYALPTLYLYVLYLSENKQRLVPLTA